MVWLSDGVADDAAARAAAALRFAEALGELGPLRIFADPAAERAVLLLPPETDRRGAGGPRAAAGGGRARSSLMLRAVGPEGEILTRQTLAFDGRREDASVRVELPLELRNQIARLELERAGGIGGVGAARRALAPPAGRPGRRAGGPGRAAAARRSSTTSSGRSRRMPSCAAARSPS